MKCFATTSLQFNWDENSSERKLLNTTQFIPILILFKIPKTTSSKKSNCCKNLMVLNISYSTDPNTDRQTTGWCLEYCTTPKKHSRVKSPLLLMVCVWADSSDTHAQQGWDLLGVKSWYKWNIFRRRGHRFAGHVYCEFAHVHANERKGKKQTMLKVSLRNKEADMWI